ncbi:winged helix-turn-helix transcriptional regulator [Pseudochryseolinea flava]|uniref:Transcriptional regulator n=1 Tax=Pseudochryseolinea flava TaxID=2059302 RepID=A0A364Y163_9BACT|nr:helix-turn-helix domain-containing protein [Pseudochryseolinea flava]RAW00563.1 transcriptional regulator [Pseudochryseolinea flava]
MATQKKDTTYSRNEKCINECDLTYVIAKIGGRWKLQILSKLDGKTLRYSALKKEFPHTTERMLALQRKGLEQDNLISRTVYAEVPPRVEYELTDIAKELIPIFAHLSTWGNRHKEVVKEKSN